MYRVFAFSFGIVVQRAINHFQNFTEQEAHISNYALTLYIVCVCVCIFVFEANNRKKIRAFSFVILLLFVQSMHFDRIMPGFVMAFLASKTTFLLKYMQLHGPIRGARTRIHT